MTIDHQENGPRRAEQELFAESAEYRGVEIKSVNCCKSGGQAATASLRFAKITLSKC
jgi:hypothetical protein